MTPEGLHTLDAAIARDLVGVFCDIDDTLTWEGRLVPDAFLALQRLRDAGLRVVPVTGRPAGWVDHIARMWPVDGCVGENGGLWFWMEEDGLRLRPDGPRLRVQKEALQDTGNPADPRGPCGPMVTWATGTPVPRSAG